MPFYAQESDTTAKNKIMFPPLLFFLCRNKESIITFADHLPVVFYVFFCHILSFLHRIQKSKQNRVPWDRNDPFMI